MSVENIDSGSASGGFPERKVNMSDTREKHEKEVKDEPEVSPQTLSKASVMGGQCEAIGEPKNPDRTEVLAWVDNMEVSELLRVLTMKDVPFLASILAVSSWSSSVKGQTDRSSGGSVEYPTLWRHLVTSSEIRAVHNRICDDFKTGEGVLITSRWISSIQASIGESRSMYSEVAGQALVSDDDIRIRKMSVDAGEMSDLQVFWSLLEHIRVVFPSAVSYVAGDVNGGSTLLTLSPSFLRKFGTRKIFDALNAGLRSFLPDNEFLSSLSSDSTWVDSLLRAAESKTQESVQIPMFAVLLFRLEHAFRQAFQASSETSVDNGGALGMSQPEVNQSASVNFDCHVFVDALAGRLREFDQLDIQDEEVRVVTSDLAKACGGADVRSIQLSDLILTPLSLVGRSMETEGIGSLAAVDDIIKTALERLSASIAKKLANGAGRTKSSPVPESAQSVRQQGQDGASQKGNSKKKRKKKSKKKQGKGRGVENNKVDTKTQQTNAADDASKGDAGGENGNKGNIEVVEPPESTEVDNPAENVAEPAEVHAAEAESVATEVSRQAEIVTLEAATVEPASATTVEASRADASVVQDVPKSQPADEVHDDGDTWETVEMKPKNQRKKGLARSNTMSSRNSTSTSSGFYDSGSKKSKEKRTPASRRKNATRKMVREILSNVVDSVEDESLRKQKLAAVPSSSENRWKKGPPLSGATKQSLAAPSNDNSIRPKTLRDIVIGNANANSARPHAGGVPSSKNTSIEQKRGQHTGDTGSKSQGAGEQAKKRHVPVDSPKRRSTSHSGDGAKKGHQNANSTPKKQDHAPSSPKREACDKLVPKSSAPTESPTKQSSSKWMKGKNVAAADQNTAPTYQETVSAMSGTSNRVADRPVTKTQVEPSKSDSSSGDTDEAPQNRERAASPVEKESTQGPPLLTFVSPENANSATSSVASSLEVPHASRRHHHSTSTPDATDVGYHLLDVCDRLSRDMKLFMNSREQAINVRRRERGAVLTALQDSLSNLWPGMCRVEMYGSCATLLDLPSSDLDVVVVGLDHSEMVLANQMAASQQPKTKRSNPTSGKHRRKNSKDGSVTSHDNGRPSLAHHGPPPPATHSPHVHHGAYVPLPIYRNSERVKQLAMQIEGQPWAVKVKSLPNASVPVIKILADPSKLPGTAVGVEWPSPVLDDSVSPDETPTAATGTTAFSSDVSISSGHPGLSQNLYEPWRGSDVMNGLISLDITFEGPEHGGLGSTEFSVHVVSEACQEAGSPPEATPFVQCLMVLKELLVQRKLNEPYSGGLSSYALLLLLLALVRERALIRQEIERVECQRQAMAEGGVATYAGALTGAATSEDPMHTSVIEAKVTEEISKASSVTASSGSMKHSQSWAKIAKKPNQTPTPSVSSEQPKKRSEAVKPKLDRPASFADAVARPTSNTKGKTVPVQSDISADASSAIDDQAKSASIDQSSLPDIQKASDDPSSLGVLSFYPQGFDDVIEVLCTGETTAGKLLMHFLLYYGQYFDAQATAIDISGKHERVFVGHPYSPYSYLSPYIPRRAPETIDPHTGMLVVDHIVIYDPLEGAENNNVARRCFAWQQVKWIFAQSYNTLSSAVERSSSPPATPSGRPTAPEGATDEVPVDHETTGGDLMDPSSPLLRCLLSF